MRFTVRLKYALDVDATSATEAYRKAEKLIKQEPSLALRGVESKQSRSVMKMLLFGY